GELGLAIGGGADYGEFPFVTAAHGGGATVGDIILEIGGTPVLGMTLGDVRGVLNSCPHPIRIKTVSPGTSARKRVFSNYTVIMFLLQSGFYPAVINKTGQPSYRFNAVVPRVSWCCPPCVVVLSPVCHGVVPCVSCCCPLCVLWCCPPCVMVLSPCVVLLSPVCRGVVPCVSWCCPLCVVLLSLVCRAVVPRVSWCCPPCVVLLSPVCRGVVPCVSCCCPLCVVLLSLVCRAVVPCVSWCCPPCVVLLSPVCGAVVPCVSWCCPPCVVLLSPVCGAVVPRVSCCCPLCVVLLSPGVWCCCPLCVVLLSPVCGAVVPRVSSPGSSLCKDLRLYLSKCFTPGSMDSQLQQLIRENLYLRAVPCTTRQPRDGEISGVDYNFVSIEDFFSLEESGALLESGKFKGLKNKHGT
ncbi:unnamed protein product, partial [Tetraodon nigroviridis]